jgi:hypothetical protein
MEPPVEAIGTVNRLAMTRTMLVGARVKLEFLGESYFKSS